MNTLHRARSFLKLPLALAIGMASFAAQQASAHGYVESPPSRAYLCTSAAGAKNTSCGAVMNEPQSVEHSESYGCGKGFFDCGPADGKIASGGLRTFSQLNEQTSSRWAKNTIKPGPNTFTWHYTAQHRTRDYQFFITKKDWNPNQPLTRASFEKTPLLEQPWGGGMPGKKTEHTVNIPSDRSGYHVVLAVWKVGDGANSFYQVVDVNIDNAGAVQSQWSDIGTVQPEALKVGDKVMTRVFSNTEQPAKQVVLNIDSKNLADANTWPFELAKKVNAANLGYRMGLLDAKDQIVPNPGKNSIFVNKGSDITNVIIDKERAGQPSELSLSGMLPEYSLKNGQVDLHFNAILKASDPKEQYSIHAKVFDATGKTIAYQHADINDLTPYFKIALKDLKAGKYDLVVISSAKSGELLQQSSSFSVKAEANTGGNEQPGNGGDKPVSDKDKPAAGGQYDYKFPEGLSSYKKDTKVLAKDGNIYKCKGHPYSGYCVQWNSSATQFEPGRGAHWKMAWERQ
ncbi:lytic polysaccharide monooxygenase [Pseudomonas sp. NFXW11]|uniref:lytic polysaccharide monooxygenase n=1 Tax=Pseudomonas sp. NFXW11 TaxID=2819531 RepID=UPI003CECD581